MQLPSPRMPVVTDELREVDAPLVCLVLCCYLEDAYKEALVFLGNTQ